MSSRSGANNTNIIIITGPTATGKTALSVELAKMVHGEIVSADSMQVYKHMDIGTAKPSRSEMGGIPHYMIDCISPEDDYSVARYVRDASKCVDDIIERGKTVVLVGGSGQYIDALIAGRVFSSRGDHELRKELEHEYDNIGGEAMLIKLSSFDSDAAQRLYPNDKKRIVRAIETFITTGKTISQHDEETKAILPRYAATKFALTYADRDDLYTRINQRVDEMISQGLQDEVKNLLDMGITQRCTAMQAIGYKEISAAIVNNSNINDAVEQVKMESRRYAKRQLTWLRRDKDVKWITWDGIADTIFAVEIITTVYNGRD
ncbi:MAG: tRNA (adenosine(37)-N6)-dimethylallyltransferase MiaA [Oscillospiraceae bacterium]|nr:tRNA (adenosine(37)-N6)-dimethylallyltransferase MiaA [Oscillospiraceae bacterium]